MVQRVELVPASVRGYGNVVSPKVVGDFEVFNCSLSQVDNVYTMVYGAGEVSVALSVSPATVTYGQSVVLEATVLEDNNPLEGVTVQFFDGNSVLGTGTSDVNGVASLTVSDLSVGSHSINAQYDSESSNSVTVTVNVPYTDITLTSDKDTLSYADGDSATLTVQLVDGQGDAVSYAGESVTFEVHKVSDDSLVETLTSGTTNSSGIATTTMSSRGTGDVYIKSSCGLVSKTFAIQDIYKAYMDTYRSDVLTQLPLPNNFEMSFIIYPSSITSNSNAFIRFNNSNTLYCGKGSSANRDITYRTNLLETASANNEHEYTLKYENNTVTFSSVTNTITIPNQTITSLYGIFVLSNSYIKNIKIKEL